jgi:hypothetical protein
MKATRNIRGTDEGDHLSIQPQLVPPETLPHIAIDINFHTEKRD